MDTPALKDDALNLTGDADIMPHGRIIALNISPEEFDQQYADGFHERVKRTVIKMSPISELHDEKTQYLVYLLRTYLSFNPVAQLRLAPFMLRNKDHDIDREPDLMVILNTNTELLKPTMMLGAPDICIEIVSKESTGRDYGEKLTEYEAIGVREYWIIDPLRNRATFYQMGTDGHYDVMLPDTDGRYTTPILPKLVVSVPDLFRHPAPDAKTVFKFVESIFNE